MNHTTKSIQAILDGAKENNLNAMVHCLNERYGFLIVDVRIHKIEENEELQILLSSYQGRVWQKVISSDEFYAS